MGTPRKCALRGWGVVFLEVFEYFGTAATLMLYLLCVGGAININIFGLASAAFRSPLRE